MSGASDLLDEVDLDPGESDPLIGGPNLGAQPFRLGQSVPEGKKQGPRFIKDKRDYLSYAVVGFFVSAFVYGAYSVIMTYKKNPNPSIEYTESSLVAAGVANAFTEIPMAVLTSWWCCEEVLRKTTPPLLISRFLHNKALACRSFLAFLTRAGLSIASALHLYSMARQADFHEKFQEVAVIIYLINYGCMYLYFMTELSQRIHFFLLKNNCIGLLRFLAFGQVSRENLERQVLLARAYEMVSNRWFADEDRLSVMIGYLINLDLESLTSSEGFCLSEINERLKTFKGDIEEGYRLYSNRESRSCIYYLRELLGIAAMVIMSPAIFFTRFNAADESFAQLHSDYCDQTQGSQLFEKILSALPATLMVGYFSYNFFKNNVWINILSLIFKLPLDLIALKKPEFIERFFKFFGFAYQSPLRPNISRCQIFILLFGLLIIWGFTGINGFASFIVQTLITAGAHEVNPGSGARGSNSSYPCNQQASGVAFLEKPYGGRENINTCSSVGMCILSLEVVLKFFHILEEKLFNNKIRVSLGLVEKHEMQSMRQKNLLALVLACIHLVDRSLPTKVIEIRLYPYSQHVPSGFLEDSRSLRGVAILYEDLRQGTSTPVTSRMASQVLPEGSNATL